MTSTNPNIEAPNILLSRGQLAVRWSLCIETIKRYEKAGRLPAVCLGPRLKRYRLCDVMRVEAEMQVAR